MMSAKTRLIPGLVVIGLVLLTATVLTSVTHAQDRARLGTFGYAHSLYRHTGASPRTPRLPFVPTPVDPDAPEVSPHSKLGIHGILSGEIPSYVQSAVNGGTRMSVVKAVDDLSYLYTVKDISPGTVTVARLTFSHEGASLVNDPSTNLEWYAGVIMDMIFDKLDEEPELAQTVDYWEPINEPLGGGVPQDAYERLAQLMMYCMDLAEERGLRLALFSFSAGTPEWSAISAIVETGVFARAKAGGHILALHEGVFGGDPIDLWYGPEHTIPGAPEVPGTGALCRRYRYWYYLLEQRDEVVPLLISEFYAGGGYGDDADVDDIVARMAWYDGKLRSDPYTIGFAPFTLGPVGEWVNQDYAFAYPALVQYMIEVAGEAHVVHLPVLAMNVPKDINRSLSPPGKDNGRPTLAPPPLRERILRPAVSAIELFFALLGLPCTWLAAPLPP